MRKPSGGRVGRPAGLPKTGGRKAGTPNRSSLVLREKLAELGCDPILELVNIAKGAQTEVSLRVQIYSSFMRHTYPSLKSMTVDENEISPDEEITLEEALSWAHHLIERFDPSANKPGTQSPNPKAEPKAQEAEDGTLDKEKDQ